MLPSVRSHTPKNKARAFSWLAERVDSYVTVIRP